MHDYTKAPVIDRGAEFSPCGLYRFKLWRTWDAEQMGLAFIMLNPSTAGVEINDPTVERCEQRARHNGYGGLIVVNLMAYRATDLSELYSLDVAKRQGPEQPENAAAIEWALASDVRVICGWGTHGPRLANTTLVVDMAKGLDTPLYSLHTNADGSPAHPLYLPYAEKPIWWGGASQYMPII